MDKFKKSYLLAGLIIEISVFGIFLIYALAYSSWFNNAEVLFIIYIMLLIGGIVLGTLVITFINKPQEELIKKNLFNLITFIIACVILFMVLITSQGLITVWNFFLLDALIFGAILNILGYIKVIQGGFTKRNIKE
jgi:uncharacterized membrane protein